MATLEEKVHSIHISIGSLSPENVVTLNDLLLPKELPKSTKTKPIVTPGAKRQVNSGKSRAKKLSHNSSQNDNESNNRLTVKQRYILATEVINGTLKTLCEVIKASTLPQIQPQHSKDKTRASKGNEVSILNPILRSPPQSLPSGKATSSQTNSVKKSRSSNTFISSGAEYRSTAECARISFACLRLLQTSNTQDVNLPPLQLESGMSVLIGKLISLGIHDLATKEIRILRRRLMLCDNKKTEVLKNTLPDLLDFGEASYNGPRLGLVITTQLQVLRLMTCAKSTRYAESILSILRSNSPSSPARLLLSASKSTKELKEKDKLARQMHNLSECLFSLCPSISPSSDALAAEPGSSASSTVAIRLQSLALHYRCLWWELAGHEGDIATEILEPFLRCLSAFIRRSKSSPSEIYSTAVEAFQNLERIKDDQLQLSEVSRSITVGIYDILACLARNNQQIDVAINWTNQSYQLTKASKVSEAKFLEVVARLVSLRLQSSIRRPEEEEQLLMLLDNLQRPFKGESSEIEELLISLSHARRAALNIFCQGHAKSEPSPTADNGISQMCESLVFLFPRLSLRYLGNSPIQNATSKEILRYEHKKQFISKLSVHAIDSALFVVKTQLGEGKTTWEFLDSRLQDCVSLIECIDLWSGYGSVQIPEATSTPSYRVKISNLYYSLFLNMLKISHNSKDTQLIRALRRSIASVQDGSSDEKKAAFFITKLERLAELCKDTGRYDELFKTLCTLRDNLIEDGILSIVTKRATFRSLKAAWSETRETTMLSRTIHAIVKVQLKHAKSVAQVTLLEDSWSEEECAIILEHELEYLCRQSTTNYKIIIELEKVVVQKLLCIYDRSRYPIRRARVLLKLLLMKFNHSSEELLQATSELDQGLVDKPSVKNTEDEGLSIYLTHYNTLLLVSREIDKKRPCLETIEKGLKTWSSLVKNSENLAQLNNNIDDIVRLLIFLQKVAEWLQINGSEWIQIVTLQLICEISVFCEVNINPDELVLNFITLGIQWLRLGYSGKAKLALDRAKNFSQRNGVSPVAKLQLYLSLSEYSLNSGDVNEAEINLASAQNLYIEAKTYLSLSKFESSLDQRVKLKLLVSNVYELYSKLALHHGSIQPALGFAKCSVRLLRRAWASIEDTKNRVDKVLERAPQVELDGLTENNLDVTLAGSSDSSLFRNYQNQANFWTIIAPLFRSLNHLSSIFAHHGVFQETVYYAEQSYKLANQVNSNVFLSMAGTTLGSIWLQGGNTKKGSELLSEAKKLLSKSQNTMNAAVLSFHFGRMHGTLGDFESEIIAYNEATTILNGLLSESYLVDSVKNDGPVDDLVKHMSQLRLKKKAIPPRRTTRAAVKGKLVEQMKSPDDMNLSLTAESPKIMGFRLLVLREKERAQILQKKASETPKYLQEAEVTLSPIDMVNHSIILARCLLFQSMEQINADPVYSTLHESTISFPAISGPAKHDRNTDKIPSPQRKALGTRNCSDHTDSIKSSADSFFNNLRRAQDCLRDSLPIALVVSPTAAVHKITNLLNSIAMLLSTARRIKGRPIIHPGLSSLVVETARNLVLQRERAAILMDPQTNLHLDESIWPQFNNVQSKIGTLGCHDENLNRFGSEFIDIIPKQWTVISISLSENHHELSLTRLQAGSSPFILRLPLGRNNSIDADEEVLGYEQGRAEMMEIMRLANKSAHDSRNRLGRESRLAWWKEREALDRRMRELLENIEKVWLGGFTGIFSQHVRRPELFSRFQKSFHNILDKYLPSRQKTKKRHSASRITLDSRILDLFLELGCAGEKERDLTEPLTDLLYFVVDILQFHGEFNAYAEIDFDMIVLEIIDALRFYHDAAHISDAVKQNRHTILILDKALHSFPWESLPCLDGLAVSRLPSLGCLRERIISEQEDLKEHKSEGYHINRQKGRYILNPSNDLKNALATFQKPLEGLDGWQGIVNREPSEEEFRNFLQETELFLYFGHGSGSQYIRAREIKKLPRCAVSMLMGCSSGALVDTGEFEPYGPALNYMHAGSHALVATLWDVTDKDIDRFAMRTLEHWGLFQSECKNMARSKQSGKEHSEVREKSTRAVSLVEAVVEGKKSCNLRYLNAAAVCVYGVPVYLEN